MGRLDVTFMGRNGARPPSSWSSLGRQYPGYVGKDSVTINPSLNSPRRPSMMTVTYDTNGRKCTPCPGRGAGSHRKRKHAGGYGRLLAKVLARSLPGIGKYPRFHFCGISGHYSRGRAADAAWMPGACRRWTAPTPDEEHSASILPFS